MNCPVCHATGFYNVFGPDCANQNCPNFHGTYTYKEAAVAEVVPRKASITYSRLTPREDDEDYDEDDGFKWEGEIEPDDDETWGERLARFIEEELGHCEYGGRWWTQSDSHTIDYSTGETEQLSAHIDDDEWTDEEITEANRLLKKRKLL